MVKLTCPMANDVILSISSYNCRGFNSSKRDYIHNTLLPSCDLLMLQEHWLSEAQLSVLSDVDRNFLHTGVSGFDCSEILSGRPYGGCAILWRVDVLAN